MGGRKSLFPLYFGHWLIQQLALEHLVEKWLFSTGGGTTVPTPLGSAGLWFIVNQSLTGLADRRLTKLVWRDVFTRCSMQLQSSWNLQRRRELFLEDWDGASKFARWQHPTLVYRARFAVPGSACRNSCWQQNDFMYNSSRDTDSTAAAEKFPGCGGSDRQIVWSSSTTFG